MKTLHAITLAIILSFGFFPLSFHAAASPDDEKFSIKSLISDLNDSNPLVRASAAGALGILKDKKAVPFLIEALKDSEPLVVDSAVSALALIADERAIVPLVQVLEKSRVARLALVQFGGLAVVSLSEALRGTDRKVVETAAYTLAEIGDQRAVLPLIKMLDDENCPGAVAHALGYLGDERAIEPLIGRLKGVFAMYASTGLLYLGTERAVEAVIEVFKTEPEDSWLRGTVKNSLVIHGKSDPVNRVLIELYKKAIDEGRVEDEAIIKSILDEIISSSE